MAMPYVILTLAPSASQQAALDQLLQQQQDPGSANYHAWVTPEQYADRFGASQADIDKISAWLGQHGLTVKSAARARNSVAFGGTAGQVESAFGVEIHHYLSGGEVHYANAGDPTVPAAFQGVARAIHGLNDFHLKARQQPRAMQPRDNTRDGQLLAPDDIATIYDISALYNAGISGTGMKLAIAGQTNIEMSDITQFRSYFNLPSNNPTLVPVPGAPTGTSQSDLGEADLDLELSGAVARNATIYFVYAYEDVMSALSYAIDQDIAPVVSISYGDCELDEGSAEAHVVETWATQANAQGQTIFAASGDNGAADCYGDGDGAAIDNALSVDLPGSLPQVTAVGGTEFNASGSAYWNTSNTSNHASARQYIPETSWNDSAAEGSPAASGGGVSTFFSKPSWQSGTGVPADGYRDVPDVSLSASPNEDGYQIYSGGSLQIIGGTSVGAPQFAGITVLLGQYLVANGFATSPNLGNINAGLYSLATVTGVFHDITTGNNMVSPCSSCQSIGYSAGVGYDQVTGLGTPDVFNFVTAWHGSVVSTKNNATMTFAANPASMTFSGSTALTATVSGSSGGTTPSGTVTFTTGTYSLGSATVNSSGVASLTLNGVQLSAGANSITAQYNGDNSYYGASANATVTITSASNGPPSIASISNSASYTAAYAAGDIISVFGSQLAPATASALSVPLPTSLAGTSVTIDDIPAPLYYVSAGQLNIQIPYGIPANTTVQLRVNNNGESAFDSFAVSAAAPAIFTTNSGGTGQGAILNTSYQLVDASNPAISRQHVYPDLLHRPGRGQ